MARLIGIRADGVPVEVPPRSFVITPEDLDFNWT
jgi:hypothetical protein